MALNLSADHRSSFVLRMAFPPSISKSYYCHHHHHLLGECILTHFILDHITAFRPWRSIRNLRGLKEQCLRWNGARTDGTVGPLIRPITAIEIEIVHKAKIEIPWTMPIGFRSAFAPRSRIEDQSVCTISKHQLLLIETAFLEQFGPFTTFTVWPPRHSTNSPIRWQTKRAMEEYKERRSQTKQLLIRWPGVWNRNV